MLSMLQCIVCVYIYNKYNDVLINNTKKKTYNYIQINQCNKFSESTNILISKTFNVKYFLFC